MDELFGTADLGVEDLGAATKHAEAGGVETAEYEFSGQTK